jgi:3,4-dihydroxy-2-butanone 4-phosphate synthase
MQKEVYYNGLDIRKPQLVRLSSLYYFTYSLDLCKLAGLQPAAIICELVRDEDGLMARRDDCVTFAKKFGLKLITIAALVEYLKQGQHRNGSS